MTLNQHQEELASFIHRELHIELQPLGCAAEVLVFIHANLVGVAGPKRTFRIRTPLGVDEIAALAACARTERQQQVTELPPRRPVQLGEFIPAGVGGHPALLVVRQIQLARAQSRLQRRKIEQGAPAPQQTSPAFMGWQVRWVTHPKRRHDFITSINSTQSPMVAPTRMTGLGPGRTR